LESEKQNLINKIKELEEIQQKQGQEKEAFKKEVRIYF